MRLAAALMIAVLATPAPGAIAATASQTTLSAKVGRSNVQVRLVIHPQAAACTPALVRLIKAQALREGEAHVRANLPKLVKKAGTDASKPGEFFGLNFLVGCPKDGTAWIAFPAEGKDKSVSRYAPELGWSPMMKL